MDKEKIQGGYRGCENQTALAVWFNMDFAFVVYLINNLPLSFMGGALRGCGLGFGGILMGTGGFLESLEPFHIEPAKKGKMANQGC